MTHPSIIVSSWTDSSFGLDVAYHYHQKIEISDLISLKNFANTEFCPRFLVDEKDMKNIGNGLNGLRVYIISTSAPHHSRVELAMRNLLLARAAKENGASQVVLVEPDLFFSAQDRGPHSTDHPQMLLPADQKKFDGQPFSSKLYAEMLHISGVDQVVTVHNHKPSVLREIYHDVYQNNRPQPAFINLDVSTLVAHFILNNVSNSKTGEELVFLAPDQGAEKFVARVKELTNLENSKLVVLEKKRLGQRRVTMTPIKDLCQLKNRNVVILDDMVRTGGTINKAIKLLVENPDTRPNKIFFYCTHTYISAEGRETLSSPYLTEFITTNTLPNVLNRDDQGRLRKKMVVMKIEAWIADALHRCLEDGIPSKELYYSPLAASAAGEFYKLDYSSRNERHGQLRRGQMSFSLSAKNIAAKNIAAKNIAAKNKP